MALRQLVEIGLSVRAVDKRVATGRLHRVHEGVFAVGHRLLSIDGHRMAAVLACGPDAVLSHRSAAALWGIRTDSRNRLDVTAPGRRGRHPVGIDAHRHGSLRPPDRTVLEGIPCTSVSRTLLDIAGVVRPRELRNAITQAEVGRLFDRTEMDELLARSRGRRGIARLRLAIAHHDPLDERSREELERMFLDLCRTGGLPRPEVNAHLLLDGAPIQPDFLWRERRLIVETDGRAVHLTPTAFERDRLRDQHLARDGWEVVRCTWRQVLDDPDDVARTVKAVLQRRRPPTRPPA